MAGNPASKTFITCAITGNLTKPEQSPYLPITPEQIATSALEAAEMSRGVLAKTNAELVTHAAGILKSLGADIATSREARAMLKLS